MSRKKWRSTRCTPAVLGTAARTLAPARAARRRAIRVSNVLIEGSLYEANCEKRGALRGGPIVGDRVRRTEDRRRLVQGRRDPVQPGQLRQGGRRVQAGLLARDHR